MSFRHQRTDVLVAAGSDEDFADVRGALEGADPDVRIVRAHGAAGMADCLRAAPPASDPGDVPRPNLLLWLPQQDGPALDESLRRLLAPPARRRLPLVVLTSE